MNLVIHTDQGGVIRVEIEPHRVLMQTIDDGPGIPDVIGIAARLVYRHARSSRYGFWRRHGIGQHQTLCGPDGCLLSVVGKGTNLTMEIDLRADERFKESGGPLDEHGKQKG